MGESLVELGHEENGESNLPGWRSEAGWTQLVLVLGLLEEQWWVNVSGWEGGAGKEGAGR